MARIPTFERREVTRAIPSVQDRRRADPGGEISAGLEQAATSVLSGFETAQQKQRTKDRRTRIGMAQTSYEEYLNGATSPVDGYRSKQGLDALNSTDDLYSQAGNVRQKLLDGFEDSDSRAAFDLWSRGRDLQFRNLTETHLSGELDRLSSANYKAMNQTLLGRIATSANDPADREAAVGELIMVTARRADDLGLDQETGQALVADAHREAALTVLDTMGNGEDIPEMQAYLESEGIAELIGGEAVKYRRVIDTWNREQRVSGVVGEVVGKTRDTDTGRVDLQRAFSMVEKRFKPGKLQDDVLEGVMQRAQLAHSDWQGRSRDAYAEAYQSFELGGRRWANIPTQQRNRLLEVDVAGYERLRRLGVAEQKARTKGGSVKKERNEISSGRLLRLRYDMANNPSRYRTMEVAAYEDGLRRLDLTPRDRAKADQKFISLNETGTREDERRVNHDPILMSEARRAGLVTGTRPNAEAMNVLSTGEDLLDEYQRSYKTKNGRWPSDAEVREEVDRLLTTGTIEGGGAFGFFDKESTLLQATAEGEAARFTEVLPESSASDPISSSKKQSIGIEGTGATGETAEQLLGGVLPEVVLSPALEASLARASAAAAPASIPAPIPVAVQLETPPGESAALADFLRPLEEAATEESTGVPAWFRSGAEAELRRRNRPVTDEAVRAAWVRWGGQ